MNIRCKLGSLLLAGTLVAQAGIIFSTDGTATPGFFPSFGTGSDNTTFSHANQFTVGAGDGGVLGQLITAGSTEGGGPFTETFSLFTDNGNTIGTLIDTIDVNVDATGQLLTGNSTTNPFLVDGGTYWLEAGLTPAAGENFFWLESNPPVGAARWYSSVSGYFSGQPFEAFALVTASDTPEPSSLWLLFAALPALAVVRKRAKIRCS
jgi:hypothetical protein